MTSARSLLIHNNVYPQANGADSFDFIVSFVQYFVHEEECLSWFCCTKVINTSSIYRNLIGQDKFCYQQQNTRLFAAKFKARNIKIYRELGC